MSIKVLEMIKKCLTLVITKTKSKYYDNLNKSVVGKMKDEIAGVSIKEFVRLKPKMYSYLVDDNSEHKKAKGASKNVVKYKDVLLGKKCLRYLMNKIQSKAHRIRTYGIRKIYYLSLL